MAKTLLEFENETLDIFSIFRIKRSSNWNAEKEDIEFSIIFNPDFPESFTLKNIVFKYDNEEHRDKKFEELKMKIGELEHVTLL